MKKQSQSIVDILLQIMPNLKDDISKRKDYVDPHAAKNLFNIWRISNKVGDKKYKRPTTVSKFEIDEMKKEGLIEVIGSNIEITDKGEKVIKVMILGDDKSSFDNDDVIIDYNQALSNIKNIKTATNTKVANSWWSRFDK